MNRQDGEEAFRNWAHRGEIVRAQTRKFGKSVKAGADRADVPRAALGAPAKPPAVGCPLNHEDEMVMSLRKVNCTQASRQTDEQSSNLGSRNDDTAAVSVLGQVDSLTRMTDKKADEELNRAIYAKAFTRVFC